MAEQRFNASIDWSQERNVWCLVFQHPLRQDAQGRVGLRVRCSLGTPDRDEAERLKEQMNHLLSNGTFWTEAAREHVKYFYDSRVVSAFYDPLTPTEQDFWTVRERVIPLSTLDDDYTHVLFVGTTGAGKTTLVRQLIGTNPRTERFPSVSAAKTTIADLEIVFSNGPFKAVVSFLPKEWIQTYIEDCVVAAALASLEDKEIEEIARKLLEHSEQRFRLSYILGDLSPVTQEENGDDLIDEEESEMENGSEQDALSPEERRALADRLLSTYLWDVQTLACLTCQELETSLNFSREAASKEDQDAFQELIEDELYHQEMFHQMVDAILDDVQARFTMLQKGQILQEQDSWPASWTFTTDSRDEFLKTIRQFSSNSAQSFGRLLTPLVQGMRIAGPFQPEWSEGPMPHLVLIDGEGLGHSPNTAASISTRITNLYEKADAIVLVDNASQPMQAAPSAVLSSVVSSGHVSKLLTCFTHFDTVKGDNLPDQMAKKNHVLSSLENAIMAIGKHLGQRASSALSSSLESRTFFVANIQNQLVPKAHATRAELNRMVLTLEEIKTLTEAEVHPVYDERLLYSYIQQATQAFHEPWKARLGLPSYAETPPEHWTRIKALSRRPAQWGMDEYDTLRPVADLIRIVSEHLKRFLEDPITWEPSHKIREETKQAAIDCIARQIYSHLHRLAHKRLISDPVRSWRIAFSRRGTGSTRVRAQDIAKIYNVAVPLSDETAEEEMDEFLMEIITLVDDAVKTGGGLLVGEYEYAGEAFYAPSDV